MEAILNQNFVFVMAGVFVILILIASFVLDEMEDEDE
jgi:phage shock protein PspC (stress-responsive transcriptional regulator)